MFKKILLILLISTNPYALRADNYCCCYNKVNLTPPADVANVTISITVLQLIMLPVMLPTAALAGLTATALSAANAAWSVVSALPLVTKISLGLTTAKYVRPYIIQTTEEKLNKLLKKISLEESTTRIEFVRCLQQNKFGSAKNAAGRPSACEDLAYAYALVSDAQLEERTKAFREGKCFCYPDADQV